MSKRPTERDDDLEPEQDAEPEQEIEASGLRSFSRPEVEALDGLGRWARHAGLAVALGAVVALLAQIAVVATVDKASVRGMRAALGPWTLIAGLLVARGALSWMAGGEFQKSATDAKAFDDGVKRLRLSFVAQMALAVVMVLTAIAFTGGSFGRQPGDLPPEAFLPGASPSDSSPGPGPAGSP